MIQQILCNTNINFTMKVWDACSILFLKEYNKYPWKVEKMVGLMISQPLQDFEIARDQNY